MAVIKFDFSKDAKLARDQAQKANTTDYTFRDINTTGMTTSTDKFTGKESAHVIDSNFDRNAVKAAIHNILTFRGGEAVLDPEFGLGPIYQMLYTPFDKHTTEKMLKTIREIIGKYEPRVEIVSIPTEYDEDTHTFSMTVHYIIPELEVEDSYQLELTQT